MVGGAADFIGQGRQFFDYMIDCCQVSPTSRVLDVGCGLGKHAVHFATFLEAPAGYEGLDIEPVRIRWCRQAITRRFAHVRFTCAPLNNGMYNGMASGRAADFVFPYAESTFDLVYLASVFTHMFDADVARYISEIGRVLKPGGNCIATFYLVTPERRQTIAAGGGAFNFSIAHEGSWVQTLAPPEAAVAHDEARLGAILDTAGLRLTRPTRYGAWDRSSDQDQDFVVFGRAG